MKFLLDILNTLPKSVRYGALAGLLILSVAYGHEVRYMTVSDFTKSYVLDLKQAIRELERDLKELDLTPRERADTEDDIQELIDELCYEMPDDPKCKED